MAHLLGAAAREEADLLRRRFYGGRSQREIAAATGIPLGTVKMRMVQALARLRELIDEEEPRMSDARRPATCWASSTPDERAAFEAELRARPRAAGRGRAARAGRRAPRGARARGVGAAPRAVPPLPAAAAGRRARARAPRRWWRRAARPAPAPRGAALAAVLLALGLAAGLSGRGRRRRRRRRRGRVVTSPRSSRATATARRARRRWPGAGERRPCALARPAAQRARRSSTSCGCSTRSTTWSRSARSACPPPAGLDVTVPLPADAGRFAALDLSLEPDDGDPAHSTISVLRAPLAEQLTAGVVARRRPRRRRRRATRRPAPARRRPTA